MIRPDEVGGLNPEDLISGDNGHVQKLDIVRTMTVADPRLRVQIVERLCVDQWGNNYLVYSAKLSDGEVWEVTDRIKPSIETRYGGLTDALFDDFRSKAFHVFGEQEKELARARADADVIAKKLLSGQPHNLGGT